MQGKVKWFDPKKGYGFIESRDQGDIFVHYSGIVMEGFKTLAEGAEVTFDVTEDGGKPHAINVQVVETGAEASEPA